MAFQIDDDKLRSALPAPVSTTREDLKWSSAFLFIAAAVIAVPVALVLAVLGVFGASP